MPEAEALQMAASTWGNIKPVVHYSESRSIEQKNPKIKPQAHSDYINLLPNNHGVRYDCMIEAKMKELALMRAIRLYESQTNAA
jgi:UV DNA damage endonuclease